MSKKYLFLACFMIGTVHCAFGLTQTKTELPPITMSTKHMTQTLMHLTTAPAVRQTQLVYRACHVLENVLGKI